MKNRPSTKFRFSGDVIEVVADGSVAFLYRELEPPMTPSPRLEWQWRIDRNIPPTDQASTETDDRPLAVHIWFDDGGGSLLGSVASLLGRPRVGHLITYVWGGKRPAGTIMPNPHYPKKGAIIILRNGSAPAKGWQREARDIAADFHASFGVAPDLSKLRYVAVSGDTDDGRTRARARIRQFKVVE